MKARKNPGNFDWSKKTHKEIAEAYGLSELEFRTESLDFLQCEGYDDAGNEYNDLHEWLTVSHPTYRDATPWQKGDDQAY